MENAASSLAKPRKRFRVTLRVTMLLVLIVGGGLGWIVHRARVQREAVKVIVKSGGFADYNGKPSGFARKKTVETNLVKRWLRDTMGDDVFDTATSVGIGFGNPQPMTDATMTALSQLDQVTAVSLQLARYSDLSRESMAKIRALRNLKAIVSQGSEDPTGFIAGLEGMTSLQSVMLIGSNPTDDDVAILAGLPALEELSIGGRDLSQSGFDRLALLKKLKTLNIFECRISDISALRGMTDLEDLVIGDFGKIPGAPLDLSPMRGLKSVTSLSLSENLVDDAQLVHLAEMKNLRSLYVRGEGITENSLPLLASLPNLDEIELLETSITSLERLGAKTASLESLYLDGSPITDDSLRPIASATRMGDLSLAKTPITDEALRHVGGLPSLRFLNLADTKITDAGLAHLVALPSLIDLNLARTRVTDAGLVHLSRIKSLDSINLNDTAITDAGASQIARMAGGNTLQLAGTPITDASLAILAGKKTLTWLNVSRTKITDAGVAHLARHAKLTHINLSGTAVTDASIDTLITIPKLYGIILADTKITKEGADRLQNALPRSRLHLERIDSD